MADLDDLGYTSILDMSHDEALDTLRQIRLSRRIPDKKVTTKQTIAKKEKEVVQNVSPEFAAELLKLLGG